MDVHHVLRAGGFQYGFIKGFQLITHLVKDREKLIHDLVQDAIQEKITTTFTQVTFLNLQTFLNSVKGVLSLFLKGDDKGLAGKDGNLLTGQPLVNQCR